MSPRSFRAAYFVAAALIVAVGAAAYLTSFSGAFVLDDHEHIELNPRIRSLAPLSAVLAHSARPVVQLTLAANHALGGLDPRGYHASNLLVHLLAALVLFAILVRTFEGARLRERFGSAAVALAASAALLWVAHPLNTAAVTYVIQRGESLAGLFCLLALHAVIRGADDRAGAVPDSRSRGHAALWNLTAATWCALAMATKPTAIVLPLTIALYDRTFLAASWRETFARRGALYAALAATWGIAACCAAAEPNPTAGFGIPLSALDYARSQPGVILHYLRLALWPSPLVFDYGWPIAHGFRAVALPAVAIAALIAATVWALVRRPPLGFLGAWFLLTLAPSSSVIPIKDLAFEHRMYLPLVAVVVLCVVAGDAALRRWAGAMRGALAIAIVAVLVAALAWTTSRRNLDYRSEAALWTDTLARRPQNPRAHYALGAALVAEGRNEEALPHLTEALRLQPGNPAARLNLGVAYSSAGRYEDAIREFDQVLGIEAASAPPFVRGVLSRAHHNRGVALAKLGRYPEAIASYRAALELAPDDPALTSSAGIAQAMRDHLDAVLRDEAPAVLGPEYSLVPASSDAKDLVLERTFRREGNGRRLGAIHVRIDLSGEEEHVSLSADGEVPQRALDALSAAMTEWMARAGAAP